MLRIIISVMAIIATLVMSAQKINPITQAMLDGYKQILDANPDDYFTLYQRAQQYYQLSYYDLALTDAKKAIANTPKKEKEMLASEWQLCANIYLQQKDYDLALDAVNNALELMPDSYSLIYLKGNVYLHLQNPEEAKKCFAAMQRMKSRSQEAYFGLAKVAILQNDFAQARSLMSEAENCDPSSYITYCRLGDLCVDMQEYEKAAVHYLSAFGLSTGQERPINSLFAVAKTDYDQTINAIDFAISKTTNVVPMYFLKGNIALTEKHYTDAYDAFRHLLDESSEYDSSICANMAMICFALNQQEEALKYANKALIADPSAQNNVIKSNVELALGNANNALIYANNALAKDANNSEALIAAAKAKIILDQYEAAIENLNEAVINDASDPLPLMLRAYIYNTFMNDSKQAMADYLRASRVETEIFPSVAYKALALTLAGKKLDGDQIVENALTKAGENAEANFYVAIYYSQSGALERAKTALDKALELGFENQYLLHNDNTANLNIAPIRHLMK